MISSPTSFTASSIRPTGTRSACPAARPASSASAAGGAGGSAGGAAAGPSSGRHGRRGRRKGRLEPRVQCVAARPRRPGRRRGPRGHRARRTEGRPGPAPTGRRASYRRSRRSSARWASRGTAANPTDAAAPLRVWTARRTSASWLPVVRPGLQAGRLRLTVEVLARLVREDLEDLRGDGERRLGVGGGDSGPPSPAVRSSESDIGHSECIRSCVGQNVRERPRGGPGAVGCRMPANVGASEPSQEASDSRTRPAPRDRLAGVPYELRGLLHPAPTSAEAACPFEPFLCVAVGPVLMAAVGRLRPAGRLGDLGGQLERRPPRPGAPRPARPGPARRRPPAGCRRSSAG